MSGDRAGSYLTRPAAIERTRDATAAQILGGVSQAVNGSRDNTFYQIDCRLDIMVNLQLAQAPVIGPQLPETRLKTGNVGDPDV
jgi:hypothetical protein